VTNDTSGELSPSPSTDLRDYLRRIANHDDVPDTIQADAREYLQYLEAVAPGSSEVTPMLPRPRFGGVS
jgi:hypothetical protein